MNLLTFMILIFSLLRFCCCCCFFEYRTRFLHEFFIPAGWEHNQTIFKEFFIWQWSKELYSKMSCGQQSLVSSSFCISSLFHWQQRLLIQSAADPALFCRKFWAKMDWIYHYDTWICGTSRRGKPWLRHLIHRTPNNGLQNGLLDATNRFHKSFLYTPFTRF